MAVSVFTEALAAAVLAGAQAGQVRLAEMGAKAGATPYPSSILH
jgi:hypothetical protein